MPAGCHTSWCTEVELKFTKIFHYLPQLIHLNCNQPEVKLAYSRISNLRLNPTHVLDHQRSYLVKCVCANSLQTLFSLAMVFMVTQASPALSTSFGSDSRSRISRTHSSGSELTRPGCCKDEDEAVEAVDEDEACRFLQPPPRPPPPPPLLEGVEARSCLYFT